MTECEFSCANGQCTCVVCGYEIVTDYSADMLHSNCPVELLADIEAGGVGTELHKILKRLGFKITLQCKCVKRLKIMNEKGPEWCQKNISLIVGWLAEEARHQKLLSYTATPRVIWKAAAKQIVERAIKNVR